MEFFFGRHAGMSLRVVRMLSVIIQDGVSHGRFPYGIIMRSIGQG